MPGCLPGTPGTLEHVATGQCLGLAGATAAASEQWANFANNNPHIHSLLRSVAAASSEEFLACLLDPTTNAKVLASAQEVGKYVISEMCFLTRSWLYEHHRARLRALGLWQAL